MAYNKNLYTSSTSALDAGIIYDQTETKMQSEVNALIKSEVNSAKSTLNQLGGRVDSTQADIAVILQDPAQDTFTEGTYVIYNNQLYTVKAGGIPAGTAASSYYPNMLTTVSGGGLNSLKNAEFVLGGVIDITDHTSASPYVLPSDGYLNVFSGSTTGDEIIVRVNNSIFTDSYCFATNHYVTSNMFVRKGMTAYVYSNTGGRGRARFYPLQIQIS